MNDQTSKYIIPGAIVLAGVIIAIAVIYSTNSGPSSSGSSQNSGHTQTAAVASLPALTSSDFVLGESNAPVTVVEYGDFQCPFCGKFFKDTEPVLREKYIKTGKIKLIWRDFAFLGPESISAANASRCAGELGKFWEYHDYLFNSQRGENQGAFTKDNLKSFASVLRLDREKFNACVDGDKYFNAVQAQTKTGGEAGVQGTPAVFINGKIYVGALPTATFTQIIDSELGNFSK